MRAASLPTLETRAGPGAWGAPSSPQKLNALDGYQVKPADAAGAARGGSVLGADHAQVLGKVAVQLRREGSRAHARGVGLDLRVAEGSQEARECCL